MRVLLLLASLSIAGCDIAPPNNRQAAEQHAAEAAADTPPAEEHTQLRDAIQQPIDRAKAANDPVEKANEERARAIDDSGG